MAGKRTVGERVYYRGDMANVDGFGEVTKLDNGWAKIGMDDGRTMRIPTCMIRDTDTGNGLTRFVTLEGHNQYQAERIAQLYGAK